MTPKPFTTSCFVSRLSVAALTQDAGVSSSWIQVAVAGEFTDPGRYGDFSITTDDLQAMADNFTAGRFPEPPTEICVDYDHLTLKIKSPGDGKAAGWFRELETRKDGTELWARVAWTDAGAEAIRNGEYRYFSPVIRWDYTTNKGEKLAAVLFNGAITNTPFLQGMQPLALSAAESDLMAMAAVITGNERRERLDEAIRQRFGSFGDRYATWLVDTEGDVAIFYDTTKTTKYWRIGFSIGRDGSVSFLGDPVEATVNYPALSATHGDDMSKKLITLQAATGGDVQIDPAVLEQTELVKELRAKVPGEGAVVVAAADFTALQASVTDLTGKVATLSADLTTEREKRTAVEAALSLSKSGDAVDALIRAGKATPAERETLIKLHQKDAELFTELTANRTVIVPLNSPKGQDGGNAQSTAEAALAAKADEIKKAQPTLSNEKAMALAIEQNPALYIAAEREAGR